MKHRSGILEERAGSQLGVEQQRLAFLAEAGSLLHASLDPQTTKEVVVKLATTQLADLCYVDIVEENEFTPLAVLSAEPSDVAIEDEVESGEPLSTKLPLNPTAQSLTDVENLDQDISKLLTIPLEARGKVFGAIRLYRLLGEDFNSDDIEFAGSFAKRAAIALDNARQHEEIKRLLSLKDDFMSMAAHELRTPLQGILGNTQLMRRVGVNERIATQALEKIEHSAKFQLRLIEDLMDVGRIGKGKIDLSFDQVEISEIINRALGDIRPSAEIKRIDLYFLPYTPGAIILGDADRLQQIITNLLANAIKFTPAGGRVEIRLSQTPGFVQVAVRDTGQGIKAEFLPHVFKKYLQFDKSAAKREGGLGLGLALVKHLVELHGGTVRAESKGEEQGSTFIVQFPLINVS